MTNRFDDELLMAFVDGELDPRQQAEVAAAAAADEDIARRIEHFRETRRLAKAAYAPDLDAPVPDALRDKIAGAVAAATAKKETSRVIPLPTRSAKGVAGVRAGWSLPLAASIAALAGALAGYWFTSGGLVGSGQQQLALGPVAESAIAEALSGTPSGSEYTTEQSSRVQMIVSFRDGKGALCREFELIPQSAAPSLGIACRNKEAWQITFAQTLTEGAGGGYSPASAAPVVDAYLETLAAGSPLSVEEEKAALAGLVE
jgi:hypothetical protein